MTGPEPDVREIARRRRAARAAATAGPRRTSPRACPALAIIAGCALIALAAPRVISAVIQLAADHTPGLIEAGQPVDGEALARLAATRRGAVEWTRDGRPWAELGLAQLKQAERDAANREKLLGHAAAALQKSVALSPVDGSAWMWLAEAELLRAGPSSKAAEAIRMSIRVAPHDRRMQVDRLELALATWQHFDDRGRAEVAGQVRLVHRHSPARLEALAKEVGRRDVVDIILEETP
jgi:hypothetical protein